MANKPFAIQDADLTLGGVKLQAGTTGVVIPGVTQAANAKVEEVNDTGDQTLWFETPPLIIDYATWHTWQAYGNANNNTFATYEATLDGEGYIDELNITDTGSYNTTLVDQNEGNDMFIWSGNTPDAFSPFVDTDWTSIPFRPKMRAGEVENISGGGGASVSYREVNYPQGSEGDTAGTIAVNAAGNAYICISDSNGNEPQSYTVQQSGSFNNNQTAGVYMALTITDSTSDEEEVIALWGDRDSAIPTGWTISGPSLAGTYQATDFGIWDGGSQDGLRYIRWLWRTGDPTTISDGDEFTVTYSPGNRHIWTSITKANALEFIDGGSITNNADTNNAGRYNIVADAEHDFIITTDEGSNEFRFTGTGLKFPDGTTQTTAYTGQAGGGSGELYIMANVDGNIVTSTDGVTWGEPVPSGVPASSGPQTIGKLAVHGGVIVYTRTDEANGDGIKGSGLYYSTEIGTATLCVGTDADPGGELFWNEVHFFPETDKWVAVGFWQYGQDSRKPIFAYSTTGISWTVKYVDSGFVSDHNIGNWSWEMTDVAYNPTDAVYVFVGKVGGDNYAGAFVTNDLDATFDASIWVDVPGMNLRSIVSWPATGIPVTGYMLGVNSGTVTDVWATWSPVSDANNWSASFSGPNSGWYQDSMNTSVGYVPDISEITANGNGVVITTADGQVAVPTFGPMVVTVPLAYTSPIHDIIRNDWTIDTFTVNPIVGSQNVNWTTYDNTVGDGNNMFHIVIDGSGNLVTCDLVSSAKDNAVNDIITLVGGTFGGTTGVDDIVITITALTIPTTTIQFTGTNSIANNGGEKIVIASVTNRDPAPETGTTSQSYNGTYYVKKNVGAGPNGSDLYELYTNQACTTPWDTHTYWPVTQDTGTLTWSHGQFFDAAGAANSYYFIGNDDEQVFRSIDGGFTWVEQADLTGMYFNDFAYGTWGSGASTSGTVTIESPFVTDFFGPEVYFVKDNYGSQVDNIDTGLSITRGDYQGIYNSADEISYSNNSSPTGTEWNDDGWGDLSNVKDRYYSNWENIMGGGTRTQGREFVMHDTINDKYYTVMFLTFQGGENGGAFSYVRRLINTDCWFNRADGDDSGYGDAVGPGLTIVRGSSNGIYNSEDEGGWNDNSSPSGTLWNADGWSDLTNITTRQYLNFYSLGKHQIGKAICGREYVMKDTINDKYYAIKFTYWSNNGNSWPGFSYTRREIDLTKISHNVKFADGSIQASAITEQRLGVLPQKLVTNSTDRYLTPDDIGKHLFVTASGTYIYITDSVLQNFPVGSVITIINKSGSNIYIRKDNDNEGGTIFGSNQNANSSEWYVEDTGSGNMITLIKISQNCDDGLYSDWMIAGAGIGTN